MRHISLAILLIPFALLASPTGAQPEPTDPYANKLAKASDEWKKTVQRMKLPPGVKADLWAAEPRVANIVSFACDEKGRCDVAKTFRLHHGVTDDRSHLCWLDDDLACRTVADRVGLYKKHLKGKLSSYELDHDRVRLVEDTKGTGRAGKLPRGYCGGKSVFFTTRFVQPGHLPGNCLADSLVPLIVNFKETEAAMLLPARFWPYALGRLWGG